jgi:hypothetical protein
MSMALKDPTPKWVTDMHTFFQAHGFYRQEDLERLLGGPSGHLQKSTSVVLQVNLPAKASDAD